MPEWVSRVAFLVAVYLAYEEQDQVFRVSE
jgi:hypothetical protein